MNSKRKKNWTFCYKTYYLKHFTRKYDFFKKSTRFLPENNAKLLGVRHIVPIKEHTEISPKTNSKPVYETV